MKRILICFGLCVSIAACAPTISASTPVVKASPTESPTQLPTSTQIPNTPSPTVEVTPSPLTTPTKAPNSLTYIDESGNEIPYELGEHVVNENLTIPELVPGEVKASLDFLAENAKLIAPGAPTMESTDAFGRNPDLITHLGEHGLSTEEIDYFTATAWPSAAYGDTPYFFVRLTPEGKSFANGTWVTIEREVADANGDKFLTVFYPGDALHEVKDTIMLDGAYSEYFRDLVNRLYREQ